MTNSDLAILFFSQLTIIIITCRLFGLLARYCGQPAVIGEMIAGVVLGPSVLGVLLGIYHQNLFPRTLTVGETAITHPSMSILYCLAQLGIVLYMFLVGLEFNNKILRQLSRQAVSISIAGILFPFFLGGMLAYYWKGDLQLWGSGTSMYQQILFLGAAMSITAFPMLARIISAQGLTGTKIGTLALAAGAIDDAVAWCILAFVLASFQSSSNIALIAVAGGISYVAFMLLIAKPLFAKFVSWCELRPRWKHLLFSIIIVLLMIVASYTDFIGIHGVFGAFILGSALPKGAFAKDLQEKIEPLTLNLLLPLFFVYSGLNTRIDLVDSLSLWALTLLVIATACAGKIIGCGVAAKLSGQETRDAWGLGALMNARGMMELIILNIGLTHGVITPTLFSIMVMMALVTTFMATPVFRLFCRESKVPAAALERL